MCSFQVLEHESDPHQFIAESVSLLHTGGRLILCVPHADSFIRREFNPLDMPPHHMSRWTHRALQSLEPLFGLSLIRVVEEPLAAYHVMGYLASRLRPLRTLPGGILLANRFVYRAIATGVHVTGIRRFLQGQSIYACFRRI